MAYLFVAVATVSSVANAERATRIFAPSNRVAQDMLAIAEGLVGDDGKVVLDDARNALFLIGTESAVARAYEVLTLQDRPVPTVAIRYRSLNLQSLSTSGLVVSWAEEPGMGIARVVSHGAVPHAGRLYRTSEDSDVKGELRVQSGEVGHVGRGRSVPLSIRTEWDGVVSGFAQGERGLTVEPRVLGNGRIRLALSSSNAIVEDDGDVDYASAETVVVVDPGETLVVGSFAEGSVTKHRGGKSHSTRADRSDDVFLLTVDLVEDEIDR